MHPGRASRQPWRVTDKLTDAPPRRRSNQTGLVAPTPVPPGAEYEWLQLHEAWQKAFREPLQKAIDVYVDHDAVEPVQLGAMIPPEKVLPSRFVLTNKLPASRPGGRWRATWIVRLGNPRRRLLQRVWWLTVTHNLICFLAAQLGWIMGYAEISAAFQKGKRLDDQWIVFIRFPKGYRTT